MKKVLCFAMLVLITAVAFAQSYREYDTPNGKSYFINHKTGKSSVYQFINNGNKNIQTELLFSDQNYYKETEIQPQHQSKREEKDDHHLTIHFDKSIMMSGGVIYISNNTTTYSGPNITWSSDWLTGEIDIPEGTYEIVAMCPDINSGVFEWVFLSDIVIAKDMDTTISFEQMATHKLSWECYDENGNLMNSNDPSFVFCGSEFTIKFPEPYQINYCGINFGSQSCPYMMISDLPAGHTILLNHFFSQPGKINIADFGELSSISGDTTLTNNPSEYKNLKVVTHASPSSKNSYLTYMYGSRTKIGDQWMAYRSTNLDTNTPSFDKDTVQVYLANTEHSFGDNFIKSNTAGVYFWDDAPSNDYHTFTRTSPLYVTSNDSITGTLWNKNASSPIYPANGIADMGNTNPCFFLSSYNNEWSSNSITFSGNALNCVYGQPNEERAMDLYLSPFEIKYNNAVKWSGSGVLNDIINGYITAPEAGIYTLSITDENFIFNGLQSCTSLENIFDLGNSDANPPVLTSFKLMNSENAICNTFLFNETATLQFSTYDYDFSTYQMNPPTSIEAYYKKHYDTTWTALTTITHPVWYDAIRCGHFYTCDFSPALSQFTGSGYLDIKLVLSDEQRNNSTQTWRPAVYVVNNTQYENDMALTTIISPVSGEDLGLENITVKIKNVGLVSQSNIPVHYKVNDEEMVSEIVPGTILSGDSTEYTFPVQADLSAESTTTFTIQASTDLTNDENADNNCQYVEITNYMIPKIAVTPTSIQMSLLPGTIKTMPLTITNNGSVPLNFNFGGGDASALCTDNLYTMGCSFGNGITDLEFLNTNMFIACSGEPAWYHDYRDTIFNLTAGQNYTINLKGGVPMVYFDMWIDFNDDFLFTDNEIVINDGFLQLGSTNYPFDFTLPSDAQFGNHIMRIRSSSFTPVTDPCASYTFGNCCDFTASVGPVWFSSDQLTGTVEPGQSQVVTLTFNTNDLEAGTYNKILFIRSDDQQNPVTEVPVTLTVIDQPWPFTITNQTHTIDIPASAEPNIFGEPLEPGDWVGVFYLDNENNEVCGGAAVINEEGNAVVTAYGDNPDTNPDKEGFATGEEFIWRMYDLSGAKEYNATATYDATMPNQGNFSNLGHSKLTSLEASPVGIETIDKEKTFVIYPNPANDKISIKLNNGKTELVTLTIMDATGRIIMKKPFTGKTILDVSAFKSGIYFVRIKDNQLNEVRKLVIQ